MKYSVFLQEDFMKRNKLMAFLIILALLINYSVILVSADSDEPGDGTTEEDILPEPTPAEILDELIREYESLLKEYCELKEEYAGDENSEIEFDDLEEKYDELKEKYGEVENAYKDAMEAYETDLEEYEKYLEEHNEKLAAAANYDNYNNDYLQYLEDYKAAYLKFEKDLAEWEFENMKWEEYCAAWDKYLKDLEEWEILQASWELWEEYEAWLEENSEEDGEFDIHCVITGRKGPLQGNNWNGNTDVNVATGIRLYRDEERIFRITVDESAHKGIITIECGYSGVENQAAPKFKNGVDTFTIIVTMAGDFKIGVINQPGTNGFKITYHSTGGLVDTAPR